MVPDRNRHQVQGRARFELTPRSQATPLSHESGASAPGPSKEGQAEGRRRLVEKLPHRFGSEALLERALTHRSAERDHNERLEFLGDAILDFVVAEALYHRIPRAREGLLTRARAAMVRRSTLAELSRQLDLGAALNLGDGESKSGGRDRDSILADALEALVGACYLDAGLEVCRAWLLGLLEGRLDHAVREETTRDPKTELQEMLQARGLPLPVYSVVAVSGAAHEQSFSVACEVSGLEEAATGTGRSRRAAEQSAARHALDLLRAAPEPGARAASST